MSRTAFRKIVYFSIVGGGAIAFLLVERSHQIFSRYWIFLVLLFLLPERILGWFLRDFFCGLRLYRERQFEESIRHIQLFIEALEKRPWLRHFIRLGMGTSSRDLKAHAYNVLGAAEIPLGRFENARDHLNASIAIDHENSLPYFYLSQLAQATGDQAGAIQWRQEARKRGFARRVTDKLVMSSQGRFASSSGGNKRR